MPDNIHGSDLRKDEIGKLQNNIHRLTTENAQLKQKLEQVNREKVEYLQNVSHQLVAPLNAIKWHIENITEARIGIDRARKVLRSIYSQATIAVHLAKNFALMSNLEEDHALSALKEPLQRISLCQLMINLADDFQPFGWDKSIQITVEKNPLESAPEVLAMKPLISQAFSNIIENAVKYSDPNTKIFIDGSYDRKDDTVSVRIKNRGIVLSKEDVEHIFDRGFRAQAARNKYPAGTGFGLYIARRIIEIHEGTISAIPENNGFVVFMVTLSVSKLEGKTRKRA